MKKATSRERATDKKRPGTIRRCMFALTALLAVAAASLLSKSSERIGSAAPASAHRAIGAIHPRISPDGQQLLFSYQGAIWRTSRAGGQMTRLTNGEGFDIEPAWSPDSKEIAFINGGNSFSGELRLISAVDGTPVKLAASVQAQGKLHFHSDGRRILGNFQTRSGQPESLAWLDRESGTLTPILNPPRSARRLSLSNDNQWIAFVTTLDVPGQQSGNDGPQNDLWKVAADGGEPERIARFPARIYDTCWAIDGESIFLTTDLGGAHYNLWQVPLAEPLRRGRQITHGQADEDRPSISSDGRWLAYTDNHAGCTSLIVRDLGSDDDVTIAITKLDFAAPTGTLQLRVIDKQSGKPTVARVTIEEKPGKFHAPVGSLYRVERNNGHFYCRQQAELALPAGTYQLRVSRGPEYRTSHSKVQIDPGRTKTETIQLDRWENFSSAGYTSGENHIHANYGYGEWYNTPQTMLDQCEGEDLNICNFMVANSDTDGVFDRSFFRGEPDPISHFGTTLYWNQEFRSTIWGHMTLVNLRQVVEPVFTGFKDTTNPWDIPTNSDIADRTHWQHGLVNYTHPAQNVDDPYLGPYTAKGLPVDVALGKIDSMDVMGSNHRAAVPLWYRLLNCGFHMPASAGTDCFLNRVRSRLPGSDRAYVWSGERFSYAAWIDGLRAGRSFVTNGPFLELEVDGRSHPGDTIELAMPRDIRVVGKARSQFPLEHVELVYNGKVIVAKEPGEQPAKDAWIDQSIPLDRSGWLALRATGRAHEDHPGSELYAHTSPVYIQIKDKPASASNDAKFFLAWIDRLQAAVRERDRIPNAELKAHVESQLDAARYIYRKLANP
jgi:hypothetical protein